MKFKIPIYLGGNMLESYLKYNLPKTFDHRRSLQKTISSRDCEEMNQSIKLNLLKFHGIYGD